MVSWQCPFVQFAIPASMHIVVIAWLYVIGAMALASASVVGGVAFFAAAGLAPVLLWLFLAGRRARTRRRSVGSGLEHEVRRGNDADAESDQR
jgi:hypothetical protein